MQSAYVESAQRELPVDLVPTYKSIKANLLDYFVVL